MAIQDDALSAAGEVIEAYESADEAIRHVVIAKVVMSAIQRDREQRVREEHLQGLRLGCLNAAVDTGKGQYASDVVLKVARSYLAFVSPPRATTE